MAREYTREIYLYINGKEINNDIKSIRKEMTELINKQARMVVGSQEYVEAGKKIKVLKGILDQHNQSLRQVDRTWRSTLNNIGDQFNRFQTLGMAVIGALVGVVAGFMKTAEAANLFEERLDNLSALTGLSGKELEWLGVKAKESSVSITESGVRIKQSATDILDAYTKMGSQRPELLKDKEALAAVTEAAIVLSEAGKMELAPATEALATTMNQFNLEAREANRIINTIAAGSKVGAGEIPYLTEVIEKSGTTANLMGVSIEQMVGTIEAVAPKFAEARRAGTSLDRVLLKMREQGIGVKDGMFDLNRAIDELRVRFAKGQSSAEIFGTEHAKMGEILVMNQGDMNNFTAEVTNTTIAFEQAGKNTDNMAAKLAQAKNRVTLMYQEIGTKLAPAVIRSTNAFNYFLKAIMGLPKFIQENRLLLIALGGAILAYNGKLLASIGAQIWDTAVRIKNTIATRAGIAAKSLDAAITTVQTTQTKTLTLWQRTATTLQWAWNAALAANPVGLVIAGITALILALSVFSRNSKANLALEASKLNLTKDLTRATKSLKDAYTEISGQVGKLNELSVQEKLDLDQKIASTLVLAEAELELLEIRRSDVKVASTRIKFGQFIGTLFNPEKRLEKARANALEAVAPIDALLEVQKDRIKSLKDQKTELNDILQAEAQADKIGTGSESEMEVKLQKYSIALKNVIKGGEDYVRIQKKIRETESDLAKARGSNMDPLMDAEKGKSLADHRIGLLKTNSDLYQDTLKNLADMEKEQGTELDETLKANLENLLDAATPFDLTDADKKAAAEYNYWLQSTYEGQREMLRDKLAKNEISEKEHADKIRVIDQEMADRKLENIERWASMATDLASTVTKFMEANKNRELIQAGKDDKKKEAIEKKYAKRQQTMATMQALIEGALEIVRINSNAGVNADLTQTLRLILTGLAVARTAGTVAVINSQQFDKGKYPGSINGKIPVIGARDKQTYQASILGKVRTGVYKKPTLGLFSEKEPEIVIDGPTTRNIQANFPQLLEAIQLARVPQYAGGLYPELGFGPQAFPAELKDLLIANYRMMQEVRNAHQRPALVSFQSLRDRQDEFDAIITKSTIS